VVLVGARGDGLWLLVCVGRGGSRCRPLIGSLGHLPNWFRRGAILCPRGWCILLRLAVFVDSFFRVPNVPMMASRYRDLC
jgi:hypothetical protein